MVAIIGVIVRVTITAGIGIADVGVGPGGNKIINKVIYRVARRIGRTALKTVSTGVAAIAIRRRIWIVLGKKRIYTKRKEQSNNKGMIKF